MIRSATFREFATMWFGRCAAAKSQRRKPGNAAASSGRDHHGATSNAYSSMRHKNRVGVWMYETCSASGRTRTPFANDDVDDITRSNEERSSAANAEG